MIETLPTFEWDALPARKPQIHWSSLDLLWKCGIAFEFRYIRKIRVEPPSTLHVGRGVDHAVMENLSEKIATGALLPIEKVKDLAADATRASFDRDGVSLADDEPQNPLLAADQAVDRAVRLAALHAEQLAPKIDPARVQAAFALEVEGFRFDVVGTRDIDERNNTIRDLKTAKKSPARTAAQTSDQGTLYALAKWVIDRAPTPVRFALDTLVDLKSGVKAVVLESTRSEDDFQAIANRIANAEKVILAGAFTPARQSDWWCSLQYCGYAPMCPYFRKPLTMNLGDAGE